MKDKLKNLIAFLRTTGCDNPVWENIVGIIIFMTLFLMFGFLIFLMVRRG